MANGISLLARLFCRPWLERIRLALLAGCARLVRPTGAPMSSWRRAHLTACHAMRTHGDHLTASVEHRYSDRGSFFVGAFGHLTGRRVSGMKETPGLMDTR
jgi:hypothetical protein